MPDPITLLLGGSLLGGLGALGSGSKQKAIQQNIGLIDSMITGLDKPNFTQEDADIMIKKIRENFRAAADVAAGRIGSTTGESLAAAGVPQGQAASDYYIQALAPTLAAGETEANKASLALLEQVLNDKARRDQLKAELMRLRTGSTEGMEDMSGFQKFLTGALAGGNLGATALGNLSQWKYANNKKYETGGGLG